MRVRWLRTARRNLDEEIAHVAQEDADAAARIYACIMERAVTLGQHPNAGRPGRISGTRELVLERYPYVIPYRVRNDAVEILRVFHTSRKQPLKW